MKLHGTALSSYNYLEALDAFLVYLPLNPCPERQALSHKPHSHRYIVAFIVMLGILKKITCIDYQWQFKCIACKTLKADWTLLLFPQVAEVVP